MNFNLIDEYNNNSTKSMSSDDYGSIGKVFTTPSKQSRTIHNWYISFFKSLSSYLTELFDNRITRFEFNYGSKKVLSYQFYRNMDREYPYCYIELQNIRQDTSLYQRQKQNHTADKSKLQFIASNNTQEEHLKMDFDWVTINISVKVMFENSMELLDFRNLLQNNIPGTGFMFYTYYYNAFIDLTNLLNHWNDDDDILNVFYKIDQTSDEVKKYALYPIQPIFNVSSVSNITDPETDLHTLDIEYEIRLKIPFIAGLYKYEKLLESIDIVVNSSHLNADVPLLTEMNNTIFRSENIKYMYLLDDNDFEKKIDEETNNIQELYLNINKEYFLEHMKNSENFFGIYMVSNYSNPNDPMNNTILYHKDTFLNIETIGSDEENLRIKLTTEDVLSADKNELNVLDKFFNNAISQKQLLIFE